MVLWCCSISTRHFKEMGITITHTGYFYSLSIHSFLAACWKRAPAIWISTYLRITARDTCLHCTQYFPVQINIIAKRRALTRATKPRIFQCRLQWRRACARQFPVVRAYWIVCNVKFWANDMLKPSRKGGNRIVSYIEPRREKQGLQLFGKRCTSNNPSLHRI